MKEGKLQLAHPLSHCKTLNRNCTMINSFEHLPPTKDELEDAARQGEKAIGISLSRGIDGTLWVNVYSVVGTRLVAVNVQLEAVALVVSMAEDHHGN